MEKGGREKKRGREEEGVAAMAIDDHMDESGVTVGLAITRKKEAENKEDKGGERKRGEGRRNEEEVVVKSISTVGGSAAGDSLAASTSTEEGGEEDLRKEMVTLRVVLGFIYT